MALVCSAKASTVTIQPRLDSLTMHNIQGQIIPAVVTLPQEPGVFPSQTHQYLFTTVTCGGGDLPTQFSWWEDDRFVVCGDGLHQGASPVYSRQPLANLGQYSDDCLTPAIL